MEYQHLKSYNIVNYIGLNSDIIECILEIDGSKKLTIFYQEQIFQS